MSRADVATQRVGSKSKRRPPAPAEAPRTPNGNGLSGDLHELLTAMRAMRAGDFSVRMTRAQAGELGKIADTFNEIVAANQRMAQEL